MFTFITCVPMQHSGSGLFWRDMHGEAFDIDCMEFWQSE